MGAPESLPRTELTRRTYTRNAVRRAVWTPVRQIVPHAQSADLPQLVAQTRGGWLTPSAKSSGLFAGFLRAVPVS